VDGVPRVADPALAEALDPLVRGAEFKTVGAVVRWTADAPVLGTSLQ